MFIIYGRDESPLKSMQNGKPCSHQSSAEYMEKSCHKFQHRLNIISESKPVLQNNNNNIENVLAKDCDQTRSNQQRTVSVQKTLKQQQTKNAKINHANM